MVAGLHDSTVKGLADSGERFDGSPLRILIVHARWNESVIKPLVEGSVQVMLASGVKRENIVIETVPGSYELPMACSRLIAASQVQASATADDLMGASSLLDSSTSSAPSSSASPSSGTFSACIAIGVLIKGSTQHFEYISEAVSHGLMRIQLDTGVPVIYGVLNCNTDEQALQRAGVGREQKGHNHGEDWGKAAVELGVKTARWAKGNIGQAQQ
ncbi:6,7-dimethyl-8-ribityllumazine synthase [Rhodotorula toruloides]|uniref:6,7-dimethyl-8-ribityllumazine synthase n=1 Tax=Rhodotorula toruloides TaxID=5286 RepID=A0A0K3C7X4_RHOTO|nr:6,7-dimethyl-8-ribityllumazine synthase [Rhodotorula toruloides]PRQ78210.1 putative 6,7-dimethyl-8-ribityllumazine synthase [Rhodotorula toruloides]